MEAELYLDGRFCKSRLALLGINQTQLAERLGKTRPFVSAKLNGKAAATLFDVVFLADMFGCSMDEVVGRKQ